MPAVEVLEPIDPTICMDHEVVDSGEGDSGHGREDDSQVVKVYRKLREG